MTTDNINDKFPAYGQFFLCQAELFGQLNYNQVFMYLFNEHLKLQRQKKPTMFPVSVRTISRNCKVGRNTAKETLSLFNNIGLISLNESACVVNADYFFSVVVLYYNADTQTKEQISQAFLAGDKKTLLTLGYAEKSLDMQMMSGGIMYQSVPSGSNQSQVAPTDTRWLSPEPLGTHENQMAPTNTTKIAKLCSHWSQVAPTRAYFDSKNDFIEHLSECFGNTENINHIRKIANFSWNDENNEVDMDIIAAFMKIGMDSIINICKNSTDWVALTRAGGGSHQSQGYALIGARGGSGGSHSNKYNKENKEMNERSSLIEDEHKDYLGVFGKVNSDLISQSQFEKDEEEDNEDSNRYQKASERNEKREAFRKSLNPYRDKPYFQSSEMLDIASDPAQCSESCYKLFLYNFWFEVYNQIVDVKEQENNDDDETSSFNSEDFLLDDIDGEIVSDEVLMECIRTASNYTIENINDGHIDGDNGAIEVNCELVDIDFNHIFDWQHATTKEGDKAHIVSFSNIRNIEADDVVEQKPSPDAKQGKRERNRQDKAYCQALRTADNSQLTKMEQAMKSFMESYVIFGERGNVEWCLDSQGNKICDNYVPGEETPRKVIPWHQFQPWIHTLRELGIVPEHFYAMFNTQPNFKEGMELDLRRVNNIFSYQKSMEWHKKHSIESRIEIETPSK